MSVIETLYAVEGTMSLKRLIFLPKSGAKENTQNDCVWEVVER